MADTANGNGGEIPEIELIIKVSIAEAKKKRKMCLVQHVECQNVKTTIRANCLRPSYYFLGMSAVRNYFKFAYSVRASIGSTLI